MDGVRSVEKVSAKYSPVPKADTTSPMENAKISILTTGRIFTSSIKKQGLKTH